MAIWRFALPLLGTDLGGGGNRGLGGFDDGLEALPDNLDLAALGKGDSLSKSDRWLPPPEFRLQRPAWWWRPVPRAEPALLRPVPLPSSSTVNASTPLLLYVFANFMLLLTAGVGPTLLLSMRPCRDRSPFRSSWLIMDVALGVREW